jgi:hypothetical protein
MRAQAEVPCALRSATPPGNQAARGRGNAFYRRQAALRQALLDEVGEEGLRRLARKLLEQALGGDVAAARTLLAHAVGKPGAAADPDRADLEEYRLVREQPGKWEVLLAAVESLPPDLATAAVRLSLGVGQALDDATAQEVLASLFKDFRAANDFFRGHRLKEERDARRRRAK